MAPLRAWPPLGVERGRPPLPVRLRVAMPWPMTQTLLCGVPRSTVLRLNNKNRAGQAQPGCNGRVEVYLKRYMRNCPSAVIRPMPRARTTTAVLVLARKRTRSWRMIMYT